MSRLASDRTCFTRFGLRRQSTSKRNQILKRFLCVFLNVAFEVPTLRYRTCRDFSRSLIVIWQVISWQSIAANVKTLASRVVVQGGQGILQSCDRPGRGATSSGHFKRRGSWHMNSGSSPMQGLQAALLLRQCIHSTAGLRVQRNLVSAAKVVLRPSFQCRVTSGMDYLNVSQSIY